MVDNWQSGLGWLVPWRQLLANALPTAWSPGRASCQLWQSVHRGRPHRVCSSFNITKVCEIVTLHCIKSRALIESQNGKMCKTLKHFRSERRLLGCVLYANRARCNWPRRRKKVAVTDRNRIPPIGTSSSYIDFPECDIHIRM